MRWLEGPVLKRWLDRGFGRTAVPVVTGGGGVPVIARGRQRFVGVEAVIDKDLAAGIVARQLEADVLLIATDVPGIALGFGTGHPHWLRKIAAGELAEAAERGEFGEGTMAPKAEAAREFVEHTGRPAIITDATSIGRALDGRAGTRVVPN